MIVISDDEEAAVRLVQLEEDEALARSLQVGGRLAWEASLGADDSPVWECS